MSLTKNIFYPEKEVIEIYGDDNKISHQYKLKGNYKISTVDSDIISINGAKSKAINITFRAFGNNITVLAYVALNAGNNFRLKEV